MVRSSSMLGFVMVLALGSATSAEATVFRFAADLSQATEVTHLNPVSPGVGFADVFLDTLANTLTMNFNYQGLVGTTTDAHIHCCTTAVGVIGGAQVATRNPLNVPGFTGTHSGNFSVVLDTSLATDWNAGFLNNAVNLGSTATAEDTLLAGLLAGRAYFNIHTLAVPGGEIAGFLVAVPEPASIALFGAGLAGLGALRRRRKATTPTA